MSIKLKWIYGILLLGSFFAAIKMLFWGYGYDEEYQLVMSYRNLMGDTMLETMYEPHQMSSFLCTFLMWIYELVVGSYTGVVIWLRFCGTLIHLLISVMIYRFCKKDLHLESGLLIALVYFNILPKLFMIPEFSNMQMWFFTLTAIFAMKYHLSGCRGIYLIGCALALVLLVLAYPSMIILLPLFWGIMFIGVSFREGIRACLKLTGICAICAVFYVGYFVVRDGSFNVFECGLRIFAWDGSHVVDSQNKNGYEVLKHIGLYILCLVGIFGGAFLWEKFVLRKKKDELLLSATNIAVMISCAIQLCVWIFLNSGYEYLQIHIVVMLICGVIYYIKGEKNLEQRLLFGVGIIGTVQLLVGVCLLTNLNLLTSFAHAGVGIVFAMMICGMQKEGSQMKMVWMLLCLTILLGKGYTMRDSGNFNNVLLSKARLIYGPAAGCITDFDTAQIYNRTYEAWESMDLKDKNMLVVSKGVHSPMNTWYMFDESQVSHYSVINPSFYNESLLEYWSLFPEKAPEVIAVESSEGKVVMEDDAWIMQYLYEDFGYTEVKEYYFVTFYIK